MAVNDGQPDASPLACGHDATTVWDRAAEGRCDAHERDCPHCQAVAADQRLLATAVTALAEETLEPPPSLVEQVMSAVLSELRPAGYLPLPTRHGQARIDRVAAAGVLRHAVDRMPALRVRSCQLHLTATGSSTVGVRISVVAQFGVDLLSATARVRQMVFAAARDVLGLPVVTVDVDVVDVWHS